MFFTGETNQYKQEEIIHSYSPGSHKTLTSNELNPRSRQHVDVLPTEDATSSHMMMVTNNQCPDTTSGVSTSSVRSPKGGKGKRRSRMGHMWKEKHRRGSKNSVNDPPNMPALLVAKDKFDDKYTCSCELKCHKSIAIDKKRELFNLFHSLDSYDSQTIYLRGLIEVFPTLRKYTKSHDDRSQNTRVYRLPNGDGFMLEVCEDFLKSTFRVTDYQLTKSAASKGSSSSRLNDLSEGQTSASRIKVVNQFEQMYKFHIKRCSTPVCHSTFRRIFYESLL